MYYVYIIKSKIKKYKYKGLTDNIDRRLNEHNLGRNKTTSPYKPFQLIFTKAFSTREEARRYEQYLKTSEGREFIDKYIDTN